MKLKLELFFGEEEEIKENQEVRLISYFQF